MATIVDKINTDSQEILTVIGDQGEISAKSNADNFLKKVLLVSAASYFELEIQGMIEIFAGQKSGSNEMLLSLVKNKAIARQYHTYFKWEDGNANNFFALFGESFKTEMKQRCKEDEELNKSIKAFLELGNLRNLLAHKNFGAYNLDQNLDDIFKMYQKANEFVIFLKNRLIEPAVAAEPSAEA
jgi:hypothetical protein